MSIEIIDVAKSYRGFTALQQIDLHVATGELVALLGPSGCGKTTLLRIIAGLEVPDRGTIRFEGNDATRRSVRERRVGFVFQHYALFKHMTVFDNVAFGLQVRPRRARPPKREIGERVHALLRLVQLEWAAARYPSQLSGGQRQRVALARALIIEPRVLLLDEPFGALDANVRRELRRWLRRLHDELHVTSVFVTHDQEEALEVADRVVVMNDGRVEQTGTPEEIYDDPTNPFVYRFLGNVNQFRAPIRDGHVQIGDSRFEIRGNAGIGASEAVVFLRPNEVEVARQRNGAPAIEAVVRHVHGMGPVVRLEAERPGIDGPIEVELPKERFRALDLGEGDAVFLTPTNLCVFVDQERHRV